MIPIGGSEGLYNWLKLDQSYIHNNYQGIFDYASWNNIDSESHLGLLWTLLGYSGADKKPWLHPIIDYEAINDLAVDAQMGCEESKELVVLYLYRLVSDIAQKFSWATHRFSLERMDIVHEGLLGIYTALEKWDPAEGTDFAYWAQKHADAAIRTTVTDKAPIVPLPHHKRLLQAKLPRIRRELEEELGRHALYDELALYIRLKKYDTGIERLLSGAELALLEVHHVGSLNVQIDDEEDGAVELIDLVGNDEVNLISGSTDHVREFEYKDLLETLMDRLDDVERFVVMNYRKGNMGSLKASEVAEELCENQMTENTYTQSAISQIFDRACFKMRSVAQSMDLDEEIIFS